MRTSFKGYYRAGGAFEPLVRPFLESQAKGVTANARERAIGGHPGEIVSWICRLEYPSSPYADKDGDVTYGKLIDYGAGGGNGCTSWPTSDAEKILPVAENKPTTIYIYPEAADIVAVGRAVRAGKSPSRAVLYWNASRLREISAPNFWPKETLEPALAQYKEDHPTGEAGASADLQEVRLIPARRTCPTLTSPRPFEGAL